MEGDGKLSIGGTSFIGLYQTVDQQSYIIIIIIYVMELGHFLTRSGLTYPEASSKVYHDSFWQMGSSVPLPLVPGGIMGSDG